MRKSKIFHLEDYPEWIQHVRNCLGEDYEYYAAGNLEEAARLFQEVAADGLEFDLAIIDISLIVEDGHGKQGFKFIEVLESSGIMAGHRIIVLSGYADVDNNLRVAFRDYNVLDVFDKGMFLEEKSGFKQLVSETLQRLRNEM